MNPSHDHLIELLFPGRSRATWFLGTIGLVAVAALLWMTPVSPAALGRADAHLGQGDAPEAAHAYDEISEQNPWADTRQEALYRSAMVHAMDLGDTEAARGRLHRLAALGGVTRAAEAWESIGRLRLDEGHPRAASRAFVNAWEVDPDAARAVQRLEAAARARTEIGDVHMALKLWRRLEREHPEHRDAGLVARAQIALAQGEAADALGLFDEAARLSENPELVTVARLGVATCLERMGDLDEALAAMDSLDLPEDVLEARKEGLRVRHAMSVGSSL